MGMAERFTPIPKQLFVTVLVVQVVVAVFAVPAVVSGDADDQQPADHANASAGQGHDGDGDLAERVLLQYEDREHRGRTPNHREDLVCNYVGLVSRFTSEGEPLHWLPGEEE